MAEPDPVESAARTAAEIIARHEQPLPADVEKAWEAWIACIHGVDARTKTLLRAAFEVGVEAGKRAEN